MKILIAFTDALKEIRNEEEMSVCVNKICLLSVSSDDGNGGIILIPFFCQSNIEWLLSSDCSHSTTCHRVPKCVVNVFKMLLEGFKSSLKIDMLLG